MTQSLAPATPLRALSNGIRDERRVAQFSSVFGEKFSDVDSQFV